VGFSDVLWGLLEQSWHCEHESTHPKRPPISLLRAQLEQDGGTWVSVIGLSRATTTFANDMTPLSPVSEGDLDLQDLLEQVQEFLGLERPVVTPIPIVAPASATVPIPVAVHQLPSQGTQKGKGVKTNGRKNSLQRIRDKLKLLLAKFGRVNRGPITISEGLVPEREEGAEVVEKRSKLFG